MKRRALLLVGAGVAALTLAGVVTAGVLLLRWGDEPGDYRGSRPPDGMMLPDFTLPDYEGESVSTQKLREVADDVARLTPALLRSIPAPATARPACQGSTFEARGHSPGRRIDTTVGDCRGLAAHGTKAWPAPLGHLTT